MSDSSDLSVGDNVVMYEEWRSEGGRVDSEQVTSKRLDIWDGFKL